MDNAPLPQAYNNSEKLTRNNRQIILPFTKENYNQMIDNTASFRQFVESMIVKYPELFPSDIKAGFRMKDIYQSKKMSIKTRRIDIAGVSYSIKPSFILPYFCGNTEVASNALFLRKFSVPYWAIAQVFGKNAMYWYKVAESLGKNSLVGTTLKNEKLLPKHINSDEKHTKLKGEKVYIATTVAEGCILGSELSRNAGEEGLTKAYGVFKKEAATINPDYSPKTVVTDGWYATKNAFLALFPTITLIQCFLHIYIKLRDRSKKKYFEQFIEVSDKLWNCYKSENKRTFSQRIRRLYEWVKQVDSLPLVIINPIKKLKDNVSFYSAAYDFKNAYRTSNMVDRLMQKMDQHLFNTKNFKGEFDSAKKSIRGWALIQNFAPYNPRTIKKHKGARSPAEKINGKVYHDDWLQNLLVSSSMGGYYQPPQKPI